MDSRNAPNGRAEEWRGSTPQRPNASASTRRPRWRASVLAALVIVYVGSWAYRYELRLIKPTANLRYYYFSDRSVVVEEFAYRLYWPLVRLDYLRQRIEQDGTRNSIHVFDRAPDPDLATLGP